MELKEALHELRKEEKRKFDQSVDVIVNLKGIDLKRDNLSTIITIPHIVKEKKVCAFLTKKATGITTVTQPDFQKYKDKKTLKNLVKSYDFFIAAAPLMPAVATTFGKILGPAGKMPSPQLGIITHEDEATIKGIVGKISQSVKIRVKEPSVKVSIGKESMTDEKIMENIRAVYHGLVAILPTKKENVRSVMVKLTMSKPLKVDIK
ncbi:hypothetical protein KW805_04755 [Candidatus Pacearchaeota archaeon]|nr:hypothetical protein [Candidatus Pacearchaeota archaeon]